MLVARGLLGGLFQIVLFAGLLLLPAGTWQWTRALQFLSIYGAVLFVSIVLLARFSPDSLEARLKPPAAKSQPLSDKVATLFLTVSLGAWFVLIPLDVFHLHLLPQPTPEVGFLGAILFFVGYAIIMIALFNNAFAAPIVMDQSDRGQVLVDTGLYARIRHPFYLGGLLFFMGLGLWLESYASLLTLLLVLVAFVVRITVEEKVLEKNLVGYSEYLGRVPYRLIPYLW